MHPLVLKMGQRLFRRAPGAYRSAYTLYKSWGDRRERALLSELIAPGMTVVDIGANIGVYSRFFAHLVGHQGSVFAFEPEPTNYRMLVDAIRHRPQIKAHQAAVSDHSGSVSLFMSNELNVDHHTYSSGDGRNSIAVEAIALDDFFRPGTHVDLLKIDVQGAEMSALRGARRVLEDNRGIRILFEYWPYGLRNAGSSGVELLDYLESLDLHCANVGAPRFDDLRSVPEEASAYTNALAQRRNDTAS